MNSAELPDFEQLRDAFDWKPSPDGSYWRTQASIIHVPSADDLSLTPAWDGREIHPTSAWDGSDRHLTRARNGKDIQPMLVWDGSHTSPTQAWGESDIHPTPASGGNIIVNGSFINGSFTNGSFTNGHLNWFDHVDTRIEAHVNSPSLSANASYAWLASYQKILKKLQKKLRSLHVPETPVAPTYENLWRTFAAPDAEIAPSNFLNYLYSRQPNSSERAELSKRVRKTMRRLGKGLRVAISRMRREVATFCGMLWCDRIWNLLHGSHPPKTTPLAILGPSRGGALAA